jgi:peptide-methionine (R)-S-oxide reductase
MFAPDAKSHRMLLGRRALLVGSGAALAGFALWRADGFNGFVTSAASDKPPKQVTIVEFTDSGERKDVITVPMVRKTDAEWKGQLSYASFEITRNAGTEIPFSGDLLTPRKT